MERRGEWHDAVTWLFVIAPVFLSSGTLKSTRMKTRFPARSISVMLFLFLQERVGGKKVIRARKRKRKCTHILKRHHCAVHANRSP